MKIQVARSQDPGVLELLRAHPTVERTEVGTTDGIEFEQGDWHRKVSVGSAQDALLALVELSDNNPMVCADHVAVPGPVAAMAMIALGPLIEAGILVERPTMMVNSEAVEASISPFLESLHWHEGVSVFHQEVDLGNVLAATVMAAIQTPEALDEIDELYSERYSRSFFVRQADDTEWDTALVTGTSKCLYDLRITAGSPHSLLTIRTMADRLHRAGPELLIQTMNVMVGLEESLGIRGT